MLDRLAALTLEVKYLDPVVPFYRDHLDLDVRDRADDRVTFAAGDSDLRLQAPGPVPRGGLHTHYAFSIPADEYGGWWEHLGRHFDLEEHTFGSAKSLYTYDPEGNCVELGQSDADGEGIRGIFEVVLEVEDLDRARRFYERLGGTVRSRGDRRRRVRLDLGPVDLELWEPHLGLADARGGVHVHLGFGSDDPTAAGEAVDDLACSAERLDDGVRLRDPDGHYLTVTES